MLWIDRSLSITHLSLFQADECHLFVLCNQLREFILVCTPHFVNLIPTFEELKRWHGLDPTNLSHIVGIINIYFDKLSFWVFRGQLFENRTDELAGTTPETIVTSSSGEIKRNATDASKEDR